MNVKVFTKSVSFLIVVILILLAFFREPGYQWMYFVLLGGWAVYLLIRSLNLLFKKLSVNIKKLKIQLIAKRQKAYYEQLINNQEQQNCIYLNEDKLLITHLNHRITDKIRAFFPEAEWNWQSPHPERITKGGTGRIKIESADEYTHADVYVDKFLRLSFEMLKIVRLKDMQNDNNAEQNQEVEADVNVADWFSFVGKEALNDIITDLNSRGKSRLFIKESGEVCVIDNDGDEVMKAELKNLPGKKHWSELVKILSEHGLKASADEESITVAWA